MPPTPSGTVTFLFTDIEGSTRLWEESPDDMRKALERHDALLRQAIDAHGGYVFSTGGDGFAVAFAAARDAVAAALVMQSALAEEPWPDGAALRVRMGVHTGEASERDGDYFGPAVNRAARLMAVAHGGQIVCSQPTAALTDPEVVPLRSLGEHRLRDLAAPEQVFQPGDGTFPPLRSVDVVPTNLPTVRTELIGRSDELAGLSELVERERLVTLTGTGGVGKTRLALGVAAALAADFVDGCWLVELAPVADGAEVSTAVAAAMRAPTTTADALVDYLADRRMLIVLDNCEHVLDAAADLVDAIVAAAPDVHVMTTSREPLGLDGEQVRRVQSLALPPADAAPSAAAVAPAVRLFVERAAAVSPGFALDADNAAAVVEICRHLDGIPLAIELAAARVRAMAPAEIARRLDERFRLLAGGSRRSQERHRTLLATVSWSHDMLDDDERATFRRLAVFPATFDLAAAEAVAGDGNVDIVDCLVRLVDRSLVVYEADTDRYRLLETLRQYGADRLAESGEAATVLARHGRHFLTVVERLHPAFADDRYPVARSQAMAEVENIRATAEWCMESGLWSELAAMCQQLWYFLLQDAPTDASAWLGALAEHGDQLEDQVLVDVLGIAAWLEVMSLGNFAAAVALAEQSHAAATRHGVLPSPVAWNAQSMATLYAGQVADAMAHVETALAVAEARGDVDSAVTALCETMHLLGMSGDHERSAAVSEEALRRARTNGQPVLISAAVISRCGSLLTGRSEPDFAAGYEVLEQNDLRTDCGGMNDSWRDVMWGLSLLGLGRPGAAERLAAAARAADRLNAGHSLEMSIRLLAVAAADAGLTEHAEALVDYAETALRPHRIDNPGQEWIQARLDEALGERPEVTSTPDLRRGDVMALVADVEDALP